MLAFLHSVLCESTLISVLCDVLNTSHAIIPPDSIYLLLEIQQMSKVRDKRVQLSNFEVSIIKGLIERREYTNQEILGNINAARRAKSLPEVNSGRISEINTGFKPYPDISPATRNVIDRFLDGLSAPPNARIETKNTDNDIDIEQLLAVNRANCNCLASSESEILEYMQSFGGKKSLMDCIPTIASFANNKVGCIVFGVRDSAHEIEGIDEKLFQDFDFAPITDAIRSCTSCDIPMTKFIYKIGDKVLGIVHVMQAVCRPVIITNNKGGVNVGYIYFRYNAQNRQIGPMELQNLIDERIRRISASTFSSLISELLTVGIENSAIYNMNTGKVTGPGGSFVIDDTILPKLNFIKQGSFENIDGAPALRVIGEVHADQGVRKAVIRKPTDAYPLSSKQLVAEVKQRVPSIKQPDIYAIMKEHEVKKNGEFSCFVFRSKQQEEEYTKSGIIPSGITSIYNFAAVDFVSREAVKLTTHLGS